MKVGVVGHAAEKFTEKTEEVARDAIRDALESNRAKLMVSGGCHMGGVDIWAEDVATVLGIGTLVHKPRVRTWSARGGFRDRNLLIARDSDVVACVVVVKLPSRFRGMKFDGCYHCQNYLAGCKLPHVKSGGCWTALKCKKREWYLVHEDGWQHWSGE